MNSKFNLFAVFTFSVFLTGCMSMPISTMYKMSQFSPFDMEPKDIRIALRTNQSIEVKSGAAQIFMSYSSDGNERLPAFYEEHKFNVQVQKIQNAEIPEILLDDLEDNEAVTILKLSDSDAQTMKNLLAKAKEYKAQEARGKGEFAISTENNCFGNLNNFTSLEVDVFLQAVKEDGYMLFLEDIDVIEEANNNDIDLQQTNRCEVG
ncbi:hypothetical protein Q4574_04130 [Aliiglaciecola sp. 3_MG-2023]|uniref:hypothetical protein n=1 Tax=Aliiglaciecola sp. 3_MG-2023 TaxID=3062644 RepID=UPI0026E1C362|nr:hypothetical protein [Aliiglaciecola sp. 3_MG-2023]MDO6692457.1 hypothetical protein [Aliiglaciecola sp. 3_MG-2023]